MFQKSEDEISIHALREEGDNHTKGKTRCGSVFLSTPSARRATRTVSFTLMYGRYFYPRPPRGGRLCALCLYCGLRKISIHALREEGD